MGPGTSLATIIKKFGIIYGNVGLYDLLMWYFYRADQGEEVTVTSFATRIEGVLSQVRDKFPKSNPTFQGTETPHGQTVPWQSKKHKG